MKDDKDKSKFPKYLAHAGRILQENGANIVKTYFCDGWEKVRNSIQTPIVVAGGQRTSEKDALTLTYNAIQAGADGVDMGRNIFQANNPHVMLNAIKQIVHHNKSDKEAFEYYKKHSPRDME
jgi:3-hydroxy-5-phosphonooxypentane-2,4-dione thiolase